MNRQEVIELTQVEAEPAVSILLPVRRAAPHHDAVRLRASQLVEEARQVVGRSYPAPEADAVLQRLDDVCEELDLRHPGDGLAIFVSPDEQHVITVPFPVVEQLAIETSFATRQLLVGMALQPRVLVLVLSEHQVRLFEDHEGDLREIQRAGFPLSVTPPRELDAPHRDRPIHEETVAEQHRIVYRAVDDALADLGEVTVPIVLAGAERELAYFDEVTRHRTMIVARVHGSYAHAHPDEIERAVRPALERAVAAAEDAAVHGVLERVATGRVVTDLSSIWEAAAAGRGHHLVIERDYVQPLHLADGLTPGEGADEPWTLDDAVDGLIEHVMRRGGSVTFVAPGKLRDVGGAALELRY